MSSIKLSPQHCLNPSLMQCYYCMKDFGVALLGRLAGDREAPRRAVWSMEPCPECQEYMTKGCILISADESRTDDPRNPWRSGGWVVVTDDFIRRLAPAVPDWETILEKRFAFVGDEIWRALRLPALPQPPEPS